MMRREKSLLIFFALCSATRRCTSLEVQMRIVGGSDAFEGQYPYQVSIRIVDSKFQCSGSILNERYVLTSAHCVKGLEALLLRIVVGTTKFMDDFSQAYEVKSVILHENYKRPSGDHAINDIALIQVSQDIIFGDNVQPVKLPSANDEIEVGTIATLTGWGTLRLGGDHPKTLQHINLRIAKQALCKQRWLFSRFILIEDSMICTMPNSGQGGCKGDSGGPLVVDGVQYGILSFGLPCAVGHYPDVYTRVTSYIEWINKHLLSS